MLQKENPQQARGPGQLPIAQLPIAQLPVAQLPIALRTASGSPPALQIEAQSASQPASPSENHSLRRAIEEMQLSGYPIADIKQRYQLLVDSVTEYALYMLDRDGSIVTWNAGAQRLKGYTAEEILGRNYSLFFLPEDVEAGLPALELEEASREGRYEVEAWRLRKDGTKFWALITLTAIRGPRAELRGFAKVTRDMTARKAAEEALRARNTELERNRIILENVREYAIFTLDANGRISSWGPGARNVLQYKSEDVMGREYSLIFTPEEIATGKHRQEMEEAERTGCCETESWRVRPDGSLFWASGTLSAVRDDTGKLTGFIRVARDMTEYKQLQDAQTRLAAELEDRVHKRTMQLEANMQELHRKNAEVEATARIAARQLQEKEVLFREIHHRVKNNLQVVQSLLKMQVRALPAGDARDAIEATILRVRSMATVHERLYQMPDLSDLPVAGFLRDIIDGVIASYSIESGRIKFDLEAEEIRLSLEKAVPFGLLANELLSNSLKHAFPGGQEGRISVSVRREGNAVRMIIHDNGVGLPENFDAGACPSMGLKLAQSLAHQLGGTLQFTSRRGCHVDGVFARL